MKRRQGPALRWTGRLLYSPERSFKHLFERDEPETDG